MRLGPSLAFSSFIAMVVTTEQGKPMGYAYGQVLKPLTFANYIPQWLEPIVF